MADTLPPAAFKNALLHRLDADTVARLKLRPVNFTHGHVFEKFDAPISGLMFLEEGLAVMTLPHPDGHAPKVGVIGNEGATGTLALLKTTCSAYQTAVVVNGHGYTSPLVAALDAFKHSEPFRTTMLAHAGDQLQDAVRMASCNAVHELAARFASFLLLVLERSHQPMLPITQEALGRLLSVRRTSLSVVAGEFRDKGLITSSRGGLEITDPAGLKSAACSCYESYVR